MYYYPVSAVLTECLILSVVEQQDSYGYEISQTVKMVASIKESTLYPILRRLETDGYLTTYSEEFQGRKRKYYSITEDGRKQLEYLRVERIPRYYRRYCGRETSKMTRKEYMEQLKKYLKRLPKEDYDNAIEYFSEYFDEAGPENEQQVMEELGQPKEAARELLLNLLQESVGDSKDITEEKTAALPAAGSYYGESSHAHSRTDSGNLSTTGYSTSVGKKRSPGKIILLAFLVICASPVSIALLFAGLAVLAAVVIVIAAVIFSMAVTGVSAIAGGIVLTGFGVTLIARSLAAACMMVGSGFLMAGAGILVGVLTIYICKWCAMGIGRLVNRLARKKVHKNE